MSKTKVALIMPALAFLTGCAGVASLHPLALPNSKETVFEPALLGTWADAETAGDVTAKFTVVPAGSGYSFTMDSESSQISGTMYLMRVGDRYLLDVYCPGDGGSLPAHLFVRLRLEKDTAWVAIMDSDWLQDQIETRGVLRHELLTGDDRRVVLTASSAELRQYLLPYVADQRAFGEESELRRIAPKGK